MMSQNEGCMLEQKKVNGWHLVRNYIDRTSRDGKVERQMDHLKNLFQVKCHIKEIFTFMVDNNVPIFPVWSSI